MSQELKFMGVNMDFAPVLDVNTNPDNPIIGVRSFGNNTGDVIKYSQPVYKTFIENNIIPVGKHFPGHGETSVDSHLDMPVVDLSLEELENIHIKPFKDAINNGLDVLMISHVFYKAFNKETLPASLSSEIITGYLKEKLNFKGLIISDDMVMGGISKHYNYLEACIKGINAGIDLFIFRNSDDEIPELIDELTEVAEKGLISFDRIDEAVNKILSVKKKYRILEITDSPEKIFPDKLENFQNEIDKIALKSVKIIKKGALLPLDKEKNYLILSPDKSKIFNLSKDLSKIPDFLLEIKCEEIVYSLDPGKEETENILNKSKSFDAVIFVEYNSVFYKNQAELIKKIKAPVILITAGALNIFDESLNIDSLLTSFCIRKPSVKALAHVLQNN